MHVDNGEAEFQKLEEEQEEDGCLWEQFMNLNSISSLSMFHLPCKPSVKLES